MSRSMRVAMLLVLLLVLPFGARVIGQTTAVSGAHATNGGQDTCAVPGSVACAITSGLNVVSAWALPLLSALAGVGLVTMALVQAAKDVFPIRRRFHRRALTDWLEGRHAVDLLPQLLELAAGGDANALYDLSVTGLMGELTTVARIVLLFPQQYERLLRTFAGAASNQDVALLVEAVNQGAKTKVPPDTLDGVRVRVGHLIERNIDALQISVSSRWERGNKLWAFAVSALVTTVAFIVFLNTLGLGVESVARLTAAMVPVIVLAGFIAPVAKDLVSALQNLRKA